MSDVVAIAAGVFLGGLALEALKWLFADGARADAIRASRRRVGFEPRGQKPR
jgi:hypothetical protein